MVGHLRDHLNVSEGVLLHWLFSGMELHNGLCVLVDDMACQFMSDSIVELGVADIFVEDAPVENGSGNDSDRERNVSDFEDELVDMQEKMSKDDCAEVMTEENLSRRRQ